ncbi:hypothetical protein ZWY2020_028916 [Hordeum vulgare]|nr:hypothetical protein ZWY2020_028916 [Hordeum vulgare]
MKLNIKKEPPEEKKDMKEKAELLLAQSHTGGRVPFDLADFHDRSSAGFSVLVRAYFRFLDARSLFAAEENDDAGVDGDDDKDDEETRRLNQLSRRQHLLDLLMQIQPYGNGMERQSLVLDAMECAVVNIFDLYDQVCAGIVEYLVAVLGARRRPCRRRGLGRERPWRRRGGTGPWRGCGCCGRNRSRARWCRPTSSSPELSACSVSSGGDPEQPADIPDDEVDLVMVPDDTGVITQLICSPVKQVHGRRKQMEAEEVEEEQVEAEQVVAGSQLPVSQVFNPSQEPAAARGNGSSEAADADSVSESDSDPEYEPHSDDSGENSEVVDLRRHARKFKKKMRDTKSWIQRDSMTAIPVELIANMEEQVEAEEEDWCYDSSDEDYSYDEDSDGELVST